MRGTGAAKGAWRAGGLARAGGSASVVAVAAVAMLAVLAVTTPPTPVEGASAAASVRVSVAACQPGDQVIVTAAGLGGPGTVPVYLAGAGQAYPLVDATADQAGGFTITVTIPTYAATGDYQVTVYDTAEDLITAPLHIGPPGAAAATAEPTVVTSAATAADTGALGPGPSAAPIDPDPLPEGVRDVAFVVLVLGSLAVAAWGAGPGRPR